MSDQGELRSAPMREEATATAPPVKEHGGGSEARDRRFEIVTGVLLACWAAMLAASDIGGDISDNSTLLTANEAASAYSWYESKSIKQDMTVNETALLDTLLATGHYDAATSAGLQKRLDEATKNAARYKMEKDEILRGSDKVGQANWVQDVDSKLGLITGADEYKARSDHYDSIGKVFHVGSLLLQICLAIGALSLLFGVPRSRLMFFWGMNLIGTVGAGFCATGYIEAFQAGMFK